MNIFTKIPAEHRYKRILESLVNKYRVIAVFQIIALVLIITLVFFFAHLYKKSVYFLIVDKFFPFSLVYLLINVNSFISIKSKMLQKYSEDIFKNWCEYIIKENNLQMFLDPLNMSNNNGSNLYSFFNKVFEFNATRLKKRTNFKFVDICTITQITTRVMPILIQQNPNILNAEPFKKLRFSLKIILLFVFLVVFCIVSNHFLFNIGKIPDAVSNWIILPLYIISICIVYYMLLYSTIIYIFFINSSFLSIRAIIIVVFLRDHPKYYPYISPIDPVINTFNISGFSVTVVETIESYLYPNQDNDVDIKDEGDKLKEKVL